MSTKNYNSSSKLISTHRARKDVINCRSLSISIQSQTKPSYPKKEPWIDNINYGYYQTMDLGRDNLLKDLPVTLYTRYNTSQDYLNHRREKNRTQSVSPNIFKNFSQDYSHTNQNLDSKYHSKMKTNNHHYSSLQNIDSASHLKDLSTTLETQSLPSTSRRNSPDFKFYSSSSNYLKAKSQSARSSPFQEFYIGCNDEPKSHYKSLTSRIFNKYLDSKNPNPRHQSRSFSQSAKMAEWDDYYKQGVFPNLRHYDLSDDEKSSIFKSCETASKPKVIQTSDYNSMENSPSQSSSSYTSDKDKLDTGFFISDTDSDVNDSELEEIYSNLKSLETVYNPKPSFESCGKQDEVKIDSIYNFNELMTKLSNNLDDQTLVNIDQNKKSVYDDLNRNTYDQERLGLFKKFDHQLIFNFNLSKLGKSDKIQMDQNNEFDCNKSCKVKEELMDDYQSQKTFPSKAEKLKSNLANNLLSSKKKQKMNLINQNNFNCLTLRNELQLNDENFEKNKNFLEDKPNFDHFKKKKDILSSWQFHNDLQISSSYEQTSLIKSSKIAKENKNLKCLKSLNEDLDQIDQYLDSCKKHLFDVQKCNGNLKNEAKMDDEKYKNLSSGLFLTEICCKKEKDQDENSFNDNSKSSSQPLESNGCQSSDFQNFRAQIVESELSKNNNKLDRKNFAKDKLVDQEVNRNDKKKLSVNETKSKEEIDKHFDINISNEEFQENCKEKTIVDEKTSNREIDKNTPQKLEKKKIIAKKVEKKFGHKDLSDCLKNQKFKNNLDHNNSPKKLKTTEMMDKKVGNKKIDKNFLNQEIDKFDNEITSPNLAYEIYEDQVLAEINLNKKSDNKSDLNKKINEISSVEVNDKKLNTSLAKSDLNKNVDKQFDLKMPFKEITSAQRTDKKINDKKSAESISNEKLDEKLDFNKSEASFDELVDKSLQDKKQTHDISTQKIVKKPLNKKQNEEMMNPKLEKKFDFLLSDDETMSANLTVENLEFNKLNKKILSNSLVDKNPKKLSLKVDFNQKGDTILDHKKLFEEITSAQKIDKDITIQTKTFNKKFDFDEIINAITPNEVVVKNLKDQKSTELNLSEKNDKQHDFNQHVTAITLNENDDNKVVEKNLSEAVSNQETRKNYEDIKSIHKIIPSENVNEIYDYISSETIIPIKQVDKNLNKNITFEEITSAHVFDQNQNEFNKEFIKQVSCEKEEHQQNLFNDKNKNEFFQKDCNNLTDHDQLEDEFLTKSIIAINQDNFCQTLKKADEKVIDETIFEVKYQVQNNQHNLDNNNLFDEKAIKELSKDQNKNDVNQVKLIESNLVEESRMKKDFDVIKNIQDKLFFQPKTETQEKNFKKTNNNSFYLKDDQSENFQANKNDVFKKKNLDNESSENETYLETGDFETKEKTKEKTEEKNIEKETEKKANFINDKLEIITQMKDKQDKQNEQNVCLKQKTDDLKFLERSWSLESEIEDLSEEKIREQFNKCKEIYENENFEREKYKNYNFKYPIFPSIQELKEEEKKEEKKEAEIKFNYHYWFETFHSDEEENNDFLNEDEFIDIYADALVADIFTNLLTDQSIISCQETILSKQQPKTSVDMFSNTLTSETFTAKLPNEQFLLENEDDVKNLKAGIESEDNSSSQNLIKNDIERIDEVEIEKDIQNLDQFKSNLQNFHMVSECIVKDIAFNDEYFTKLPKAITSIKLLECEQNYKPNNVGLKNLEPIHVDNRNQTLDQNVNNLVNNPNSTFQKNKVNQIKKSEKNKNQYDIYPIKKNHSFSSIDKSKNQNYLDIKENIYKKSNHDENGVKKKKKDQNQEQKMEKKKEEKQLSYDEDDEQNKNLVNYKSSQLKMNENKKIETNESFKLKKSNKCIWITSQLKKLNLFSKSFANCYTILVIFLIIFLIMIICSTYFSQNSQPTKTSNYIKSCDFSSPQSKHCSL